MKRKPAALADPPAVYVGTVRLPHNLVPAGREDVLCDLYRVGIEERRVCTGESQWRADEHYIPKRFIEVR